MKAGCGVFEKGEAWTGSQKVDFNNVRYENTAADFQTCKRPERAPDWTSHNGSEYWDMGNGLVRGSTYWGFYVRSCAWFIDAKEVDGAWHLGFCKYSDFKKNYNECATYAVLNKKRERRWEESRAREEGERVKREEIEQEEERRLSTPGNRVKVTRREYSRVPGSYRPHASSCYAWMPCETEIVFTVAKRTPCFVVAKDGKRYDRGTLSNVRILRRARRQQSKEEAVTA